MITRSKRRPLNAVPCLGLWSDAVAKEKPGSERGKGVLGEYDVREIDIGSITRKAAYRFSANVFARTGRRLPRELGPMKSLVLQPRFRQ